MKKFFSEIFSSLRKKDGTVALTSLSLQAGSIILTLILNLFLARIMLPADYGAFAYASTLIFVLGNLGTFGTTNLIVKETGAVQDLSYIKKLLRWSAGRSSIFIILILAIFIFISLKFNWFFGKEQMNAYRIPMLISLACVPLLSFLYMLQAFLQGRGKIFSALFSEKILKSVLFLAAASILFFASGKEPLQFVPAAVINFATFFAAVLLMFLAMGKQTRHQNIADVSDEVLNRWKKSTRTFFMFSIFSMIYLRADMLCLGFFESPEQLGVYNVSSRVAEAVSFPLHVIMFGIAPVVAGLYSSHDRTQLQQTVTSAVRFMFVLSAVPAVIFILFGTPILHLFGEHFESGYLPMVILILGHMLNIIAGPSGYILNMTGHERLAFISMAMACVANIGFNLILIPGYGIAGAAIAMSLGMLVWNLLITYFVISRTGIRPDIFYFFRKQNL
jgi:O-antigen/teichoic acid export membrane protein